MFIRMVCFYAFLFPFSYGALTGTRGASQYRFHYEAVHRYGSLHYEEVEISFVLEKKEVRLWEITLFVEGRFRVERVLEQRGAGRFALFCRFDGRVFLNGEEVAFGPKSSRLLLIVSVEGEVQVFYEVVESTTRSTSQDLTETGGSNETPEPDPEDNP